MATRVSSPTFVGRRHELDRVRAVLAGAREGRPGVVLIAGEAGVGKTRFVREIAAGAVDSGTGVLEGSCVQVGDEGLPFGPFIQAFRGLTRGLSQTELDELLGVGRAELARLMPQLRAPVETMTQSWSTDSSAQGRLFEHVVLLLERLASSTSLLLILEDVHWADLSTLALLGYLARNLRDVNIALVVTYRSDELNRRHPLMPFLAEQERAGQAERIELQRFTRPELTAQLEAITGSRPGPELLERVIARSQGNAFYAEELLAAGSQGRMPDTLREVLVTRVSAMSGPTQDVVRVAAAGGARVSTALLGRVTGLEEAHLETALREALGVHVLVSVDGAGDDQYGFRHALMQEAVYGELLASERTRLHAAYALALTADAEPGDATQTAQLAYHWQAAHDLPRAFDAWIAAAVAAERIYAFADAAASYERVLGLWEQVPDAASRSRLDRIDVLSRTAFAINGTSPHRAVSYARAAIGLIDPTTDPVRAGLLHERLGQYNRDLFDFPAALAAYVEAVRLVPAEPLSAARAWVLSGLAAQLANVDRNAESASLCREALSTATAVGDREAELRALVPLGFNLVKLGDVDAGMAVYGRAAELAIELGNVDEIARVMGWSSSALFEAGRDEAAATAALRAEAYAAEHGLSNGRGAYAVLTIIDALLPLGRWDEAAATIERTERLSLVGTVELGIEEGRVRLEALRGRFDIADRSARRVRELAGGNNAYTFQGLAELALWRGEPLAAREIARDAIAALNAPQASVRWLGCALALGLRAEADLAALARAGRSDADLREARKSGRALLDRMRALIAEVNAQRPYFAGTAGQWLASCEAEFSRLDGESDPDVWAAAAAAWQGNLYLRGYSRMREGAAALVRRDGARAVAALDEAEGIARSLGAEPLRQAVETLSALIPGPKSADGRSAAHHLRGQFDLSRREREVLRLLVAGRSDGEIGESLFISPKTASVHVSHIKEKLGAQNRVEIATHAIGLGLVETPSSATPVEGRNPMSTAQPGE